MSGGLTFYDRGATPFFAAEMDQRFSFTLYVPDAYDERTAKRYHLTVIVHSTDRPAAEYRNAFAEFATDNDCIIMAPLFPAGIGDPNELNDYKFISYNGIRFDLILLSMVDQVRAKYRIHDRMLMHGFSGGGHFTHRFLYLHPDRLLAASIGAPGLVTVLDRDLPWWAGVGDLEHHFGQDLDIDAIRRVAVQLVIGGDDTETWEITLPPDHPLWVEGANDAGRTRLDRLESLRRSYERERITVRHDVVPGVAHHGFPLVPTVADFFATVLKDAASGVDAAAG